MRSLPDNGHSFPIEMAINFNINEMKRKESGQQTKNTHSTQCEDDNKFYDFSM